MLKLKLFAEDQSAICALEYGIIASLIAVVILSAVGALGTALSATFSSLAIALAG